MRFVRDVLLRSFASRVLMAAGVLFAEHAQADTFGFAADPNSFVTSYEGFNFGPGSTSWVNGSKIPANATPSTPLGYAWSNGGNAISMTLASPGTFTFNSVDLFQNAAAQGAPAQSVTIEGLLGGLEVDSFTTPPLSSTTAFTTFDFDWAGIDELTFSATLDNLSLTNFVVNEPLSAVPEPASLLVVGTALAGLCAFRRRRRESLAAEVRSVIAAP
jgi:hypothetical protein